MPFGLIAVMDLLGYKEKSREVSGEELIARLSQLRDAGKEKSSEKYGLTFYEEDVSMLTPLQTAFVSDTFIAALSYRKGDLDSTEDAFQVIFEYIAEVQIEAAKLGFPVRGSVGVGDFAIQDNMIAGRGIYDTYSIAELGQEAVVHLSPQAKYVSDEIATRMREYLRKRMEVGTPLEVKSPDRSVREYINQPFPHYDLTFKGETVHLPVVNPYFFIRNGVDATEFTKNVLLEMKKPELSIYNKYHRTQVLYDQLRADARKAQQGFDELSKLYQTIAIAEAAALTRKTQKG